MSPQSHTKMCTDLRKSGCSKNSRLHRRTHQLVNQYQMVSSENINRTNIMHTEQVVFIYLGMCVCERERQTDRDRERTMKNREIEAMNFRGARRNILEGLEGRKRSGSDVIIL